jgi:hypothetical protein
MILNTLDTLYRVSHMLFTGVFSNSDANICEI